MFNLKINPLLIEVESLVSFPVSFEVQPFIADKDIHDENAIVYRIDFIEEFAPVWGELLYSDRTLSVMQVDGKELRIHILPDKNLPYAITQYIDDKNIQILIDKRVASSVKWDRNLLGLFSLEHLCLGFHSFLLHAAFIIYNGQAIVFTAPSGTGKSTQAQLWADHEKAEIINGDRTLLVMKEGIWHASGFPVCGSSRYCLNKSAPVKAIVCLEQNEADTIDRLLIKDAFSKIYSQSFINSWNRSDIMCITDMIQEVCCSVPIYLLSCTKEKSAVMCLKKEIFAGD